MGPVASRGPPEVMGAKMEEVGLSGGDQKKTEKGKSSGGPGKTDEAVKTDQGTTSQDQNGQLESGEKSKDKEMAGTKGKTDGKEEKQDREGLFRRILRRFSMRKKKKAKKTSPSDGDTVDGSAQVVEPKIVEEVTIEVTEERPPTPPTAPLGRPPLPRGTPVSATTYHSRPVSDLDSALKAFKASTMASRENLRTLGSTRDLSLLEKVANRPPLARPAQQARVRRQPSLRVVRPKSEAEGEMEDKDLKQLSSSMSCLRAEQKEEP